ncbi:MAG: hypothetical protein ACYTKD_13405 [Planctomycetota bacterium]
MKHDGERFHFTRRHFLWAALVVLAVTAIVGSAVLVRRDRPRRAGSEIKCLMVALHRYYQEMGAYPPDTAPWNDDVWDSRSLQRYLCRQVQDERTGRTFGPYIRVSSDWVRDVDDDGVGVYVDPWGNPYHLDAMHVRVNAEGEWEAVGTPYPPSVPAEKRVRDCKIVSFGPDGVSADYPFGEDAPDPRADDDIRSW